MEYQIATENDTTHLLIKCTVTKLCIFYGEIMRFFFNLCNLIKAYVEFRPMQQPWPKSWENLLTFSFFDNTNQIARCWDNIFRFEILWKKNCLILVTCVLSCEQKCSRKLNFVIFKIEPTVFKILRVDNCALNRVPKKRPFSKASLYKLNIVPWTILWL